jgi:colanic acid/amylovoran biosynthesis glycosyltransferase
MKIAFIVSHFPAISETFILDQITGLLDLGHEVDIFASQRGPGRKVHPDVGKYDLVSRTRYAHMPSSIITRLLLAPGAFIIRGSRAPLRTAMTLNVWKYGREALNLGLFYRACSFIGHDVYDIVHCHFGPNGNIGALLMESGFIKGKLIATFHGYDANVRRITDRRDVYGPLIEHASRITVNSDFTRSMVEKLGFDPGRIAVHPVGLDLADYALHAKSIERGDAIKLLTVARLVEKKGLEYSIRAVARISSKNPDVQYRIAGDGPLRGPLEDLIRRLDVGDHVRILGWKDMHEIRQLYRESHIFILPSVTAATGDSEGQGLVLQEAQASGLPVVSTRHNGIPEGVLDGKSGYLVPERDVDALADRIGFLIEHPEKWPEMGRSGRKFVEEKYDIVKLNGKLVELYESVLSS